jgi:hypothetical protein
MDQKKNALPQIGLLYDKKMLTFSEIKVGESNQANCN